MPENAKVRMRRYSFRRSLTEQEYMSVVSDAAYKDFEQISIPQKRKFRTNENAMEGWKRVIATRRVS